MTISESQLVALHNLALKEAGNTVGWINISDAQALTELGLARRSREGWEITLDGAFLAQQQPAVLCPSASAPIPFAPRPH